MNIKWLGLVGRNFVPPNLKGEIAIGWGVFVVPGFQSKIFS